MMRASRWSWSCLALMISSVPALAAGNSRIAPLVARIRAVGPEGAGNVEAAAAWKELAQLDGGAMPAILASMDDADPIAANWLRAAVDTIAERELAAGRPLPRRELEGLVRDTRQAAMARRAAYEWLLRVDPTAPQRLLPGMLHDPAPPLRRDAVERLVHQAEHRRQQSDRAAALADYRKALRSALDDDQVQRIAERLKTWGIEVDRAAHFGFLRQWMLLGPFDNRNDTGFDAAGEPEHAVDLSHGYRGKDGLPLHWKPYTTPDAAGIVDLNKALGRHAGATAYAYTVVFSPTDRAAQVRAGSENAIKIFLNGQLVFARHEYHHGMRMDQHLAAVHLKAGRNELLLKVCQNEQPEEWAHKWSFQLRLTDSSGEKIPLQIQELGGK